MERSYRDVRAQGDQGLLPLGLDLENPSPALEGAQRLLRNRPDIFPDDTSPGFRRAFRESFVIADCQRVGDAERWPYLMARREQPSA